uniref:Uncharacterized protein n=1 Tax=Monodon monoceros TaxID=40151 RepID=A0A8C6CEB3_MONMO
MLLTLLSVALLALSAQGPFDEGNSEGFLNLISAETTPTKRSSSSPFSPTSSWEESGNAIPRTWTRKTSPGPTTPVIW